MSVLVKKVQNFAFHQGLFRKGSKIIVGVSGGPDSVCLLDIFVALREKYNLKLRIAHVNYGLRGKESDGDEKFVEQLAKKCNIEINVLRSRKVKKGENLENTLRNIRYEFFEELRKKHKFDHIAVAHNQDDQAETVLMHIMRGSGLQGLAAMKAKNGYIIRPLLNTDKEDILKYLRENKISYRIDVTNADTEFMRNNIRHKLLPYIEKNFNPSIKQVLYSLSMSAAQDYDFIAKETLKEAKYLKKEDGSIQFVIHDMLYLHPSLQKQFLRNAIELVSGIGNVEYQHIEELIKIAKSTKSKQQKMVFNGLKINKKGDTVTISPKLN